MFDEETKKAIFLNAVLMAYSDGTLDKRESELIRAFMDKAGISNEEAKKWRTELSHGNLNFRSVDNRDDAVKTLKIAVGVVAADGKLHPKERTALNSLAKALGFSYDELKEIYLDAWGKDVVAELFPTAPTPPPQETTEEAVIIIRDHFEHIMDEFVATSSDVQLRPATLENIQGHRLETPAIVFHAAPKREDSVGIATMLRKLAPNARLLLVADRHQAPQISYVLEAGAFRCIIAPVYPGELRRMIEMEASPGLHAG